MQPPKWNPDDASQGESGRIWLDSVTIRYESRIYDNFEVAAGEVRVVGEYTNQSGPYQDDYFLVLVTPDRVLYWSFDAAGRDEFLRELGRVLSGLLDVGLCGSTDFKSRVLWPPTMAGAPLFHFRAHKSIGLLEKLTSLVVPKVDMELTEEVRKESGNSQLS